MIDFNFETFLLFNFVHMNDKNFMFAWIPKRSNSFILRDNINNFLKPNSIISSFENILDRKIIRISNAKEYEQMLKDCLL